MTPPPAGDGELVRFLEPDQLAEDSRRRLPPAQLGLPIRVLLWVMRILATVLTAMVVYTFAVQLH